MAGKTAPPISKAKCSLERCPNFVNAKDLSAKRAPHSFFPQKPATLDITILWSSSPRPSSFICCLSSHFPWLLQLPLRSPCSTEGPESMFSLSPALPLNNTTTLLGRYLPGSFVASQTVSSRSDSLEPRHVYHLRSFKKGRLASPRSWAVPNPNISVCFHVPRL